MADKVVAKYVADVKDYIKEIEKATGIAQKDFEKVNESASGLESGLKKIGGAVAAAFAVDRIVAFGAEASKLAAEAEGVRTAFQRIGDPKLLQGLRDATKGTVSDLELMKGAVRASNFKIPLEQLAKLFEFARRRAKETGESVDFLVNSIVMGIGRKSPLILDNLGISAIELRKRFEGISIASAEVGDVAKIVGDIATEEMQKMGDEVLSTKDKMDRLNASTDNLKVALGTIINEAVGPMMAGLSSVVTAIADEITEVDRFAATLSKATVGEIDKSIQAQKAIVDEMESDLTARIGKISEAQIKISQERINTEREKLALAEKLRAERETIIPIDEMTIDNINKITKSTADQNEQTAEQIRNVAFYKALIKELTTEQNAQNTTLERNTQIVKELVDARAKLDALLGKDKGKGVPFVDEIDEEAKHNVEGMTGAVFDLGEALQSVFGDGAESQIQSELDAMMAATDEQIAADNAATQQRIANIDQYRGVAIDAAYMISDVVIAQTERRIAHEQSLLQQQFEQGLLTQEQFDQKSAELKRKQAQAAKDAATFNAILGTAQAVMQALANNAPPASYGLAAAAAVMGGVQVGLIQSEPLPAFAKGTKDAPSGFKWVGEEGPELIYDGGGYPIITHKESMKILEKYNIETVDLDGIQKGGFGALGESAKLQGFNDRNLLVATDRLRQSNKEGFMYMADRIAESMKKSSRNDW